MRFPAQADRAISQGRVLVMDDEPLVRNIIGEMIVALGHEAEVAEHGAEAIQKYQAALA